MEHQLQRAVLDTTWKVYEIKDSSLVQPLANHPVVWTGVTRPRPAG